MVRAAQRFVDDADRYRSLLAERADADRAITQTSTELDATRRALTDHRAAASNVIQALSTRFDAVLHEFLPGIGAGEIKLDGKGLSLKVQMGGERSTDRKSTRLNSSH